MKRRLMIARALVHEPKLLILDEPTAGVDIEIRRSMWKFLRKINAEGTTIILTTHYLEEAESLCRQVAIIDEGRIVMNDRIIGIMSSGAPSSRNRGSIVSKPTNDTAAVITNDRIKLSVVSRCARRGSPDPIALATTDEVPAPRPIATLVTIMRIGKPKLYAASARSPTLPKK